MQQVMLPLNVTDILDFAMMPNTTRPGNSNIRSG